MATTQIPAVITYHKPGTQPPLYVAGTFSDPPWEPCEMDHTARPDGEYDFKKEVRGEPGSKIQYKFRVGDGGWWVLKEDGPTETDSAGNTNHVLEVNAQQEPSHETARDSEANQSQHNTDGGAPPSYAKVAAKRIQPTAEEAGANRSGTGTPITARVAAEVADTAELLHEEVPEREEVEDTAGARRRGSNMSEAAETAAEVADTAETLDNEQDTILILEPPEGEGRPHRVQPQSYDFADEQEGYVADKSPLFAHECAGLYESDPESDQEDSDAPEAARVEDLDPDQVDLNDPTLERFPSSRADIMDAVRKLESGLKADQPSFDGNAPSPLINPSRRGTQDITGDFDLTVPQPSSPSQRPTKRSMRDSVGSIAAAASLHSISEAEEPAAEEDDFRSAVVFSNPLKPKPKHLKLPTSDEDEGIALPDGVSPRTVKPPRPPVMASGSSSPESPTSPKSQRKGSAQVGEQSQNKEPSTQEVQQHPLQPGNPGPTDTDPPNATEGPGGPEGPSYAQVASSEPTDAGEQSESRAATSHAQGDEASAENKSAAPQVASTDGPSDTKDMAFQDPAARRPSYAEIVKSQPTDAEGSGESKDAAAAKDSTESKPAPQPQGTDRGAEGKETTSRSPTDRRPSYAEVAASKPRDTESGPSDNKAQPSTADSSTTAKGKDKASASTTARDDKGNGKDTDESQQLRKRGGTGRDEAAAARSPDSRTRAPAVQPKRGGGWIRAIFKLIFVDFAVGVFRRVLRMFRFGLGRRGGRA